MGLDSRGHYGIHPTTGSFFSIAKEFEYRALLLNPLYRHVADTWGVATTSMEYQRWVDEGLARCWRYDYAQVVAMGITDIPSDILRIMNNVNEITIRFIPRLVTAATEAEFYALQQEYWDEIVAAGEATAWEWASRTVIGTSMTVFCCMWLGYLFSKEQMPFRKTLYRMLTVTMYVSGGLHPHLPGNASIWACGVLWYLCTAHDGERVYGHFHTGYYVLSTVTAFFCQRTYFGGC